MSKLVEQLKAASRAGVPIVSIDTPDPAATVRRCCEALNGERPKLQWDLVRGVRPLTDESMSAMRGDSDGTVMNPVGALLFAEQVPEKTVVFILNAHRYLEDTPFMQAVWNLRDEFKQNQRMLVLLGPAIKLPVELTSDVIALSEPLPDRAEREAIVRSMHEAAGLTPDAETLERATATVSGLAAFPIEQLTAMSLSKSGLQLEGMRERVYRQIEQTEGLSVFRGPESFASIGGCGYAKTRYSRICRGRYRPQAIVRFDEIDKQMAGTGDLSGISQDALGAILSCMEDNKIRGILNLGPPGCSKSLIANAIGNEVGVPTVNFDLGAMRGSLVGQSEAKIRAALKVILTISDGRPLFVATANSIERLNTALLRRFAVQFYFDLPDASERAAIWPIHMGRLDLPTQDLPDDRLWAGADIRNCCESAWEEDVSLVEAAQGVVPVGVRSAEEINRLRQQATGRFLSANYPGTYSKAGGTGVPGRGLNLN